MDNAKTQLPQLGQFFIIEMSMGKQLKCSYHVRSKILRKPRIVSQFLLQLDILLWRQLFVSKERQKTMTVRRRTIKFMVRRLERLAAALAYRSLTF